MKSIFDDYPGLKEKLDAVAPMSEEAQRLIRTAIIERGAREVSEAFFNDTPLKVEPYPKVNTSLALPRNTRVINLFAGPGAGKSTNAAGTFAELKRRGHLAELVTEYAKDCVWRDAHSILSDQIYVFAKQRNRIRYLLGKVDVVVTDSPILLSLAYMPPELDESIFRDLVIEQFMDLDSLNVFIQRSKPYVQEGRMQDEAGAREKDVLIRGLLDEVGATVFQYPDTDFLPRQIADLYEMGLGYR